MRCAGGSVNDNGMEQSFDPRQVGNANLIYILYLIGVAVPIVGLIGLVMAYNARATAPAAVDNHYRNQINIFWKMLLFMVVGAVLTLIIVVVPVRRSCAKICAASLTRWLISSIEAVSPSVALETLWMFAVA